MTKIVVLVHPFYSAYNWVYHDDLTSSDVRKGITFLFGAWGKKLKDASNNPGTFIFLLKPTSDTEEAVLKLEKLSSKKTTSAMRWVDSKMLRFEKFLKRKFGDRLMVIPAGVDKDGPVSATFENIDIKERLKEHGIYFSKNVTAKLFGEYFDLCVDEEKKFLEKALKLPKQRVRKSARLSLSSPYSGKHSDELTLGDSYLGVRRFFKLKNPRRKRR